MGFHALIAGNPFYGFWLLLKCLQEIIFLNITESLLRFISGHYSGHKNTIFKSKRRHYLSFYEVNEFKEGILLLFFLSCLRCQAGHRYG